MFDAATGAYKRHFSGRAGDSDSRPSAARKVAKDGTVYVCDRGNNRVQAFDKAGKFLEAGRRLADDPRHRLGLGHRVVERSRSSASCSSPTATIRKIFILRRDTLETVGSFGDGGRYPGTFYSVGSVAVDSKGNVYTGETLEGKRVQKFILKGAGR